MKNEKLYELIVDWLAGNLDEIQEVSLKLELKNRSQDIDDLEELKQLIETMDEISIPAPSQEMTDGFYEMLDKADVKIRRRRGILNIFSGLKDGLVQKGFAGIAYAAVLLLIGFVLGFLLTSRPGNSHKMNEMSAEINQMQEMIVFAMLDKSAPSDRIKAIQLTSQMDKINPNIVDGLLFTLNNDPNDNVRLIAAEALLAFAQNDNVRHGLLESIEQQDSPIIQMTLTDGLVAMEEKKSIPYLRRLLDRQDIFDEVRAKLETGIQILSKI